MANLLDSANDRLRKERVRPIDHTNDPNHSKASFLPLQRLLISRKFSHGGSGPRNDEDSGLKVPQRSYERG